MPAIRLYLATPSTFCFCSASCANIEPPSPIFQKQVLYLLISYPLDYLWALTAFSTRRWKKRVEDRVLDRQAKVCLIQGDADQFTKSAVSRKVVKAEAGQASCVNTAPDGEPSLTFTSLSAPPLVGWRTNRGPRLNQSYRKWLDTLHALRHSVGAEVASDSFQSKTVEGVDHFWGAAGGRAALVQAIGNLAAGESL